MRTEYTKIIVYRKLWNKQNLNIVIIQPPRIVCMLKSLLFIVYIMFQLVHSPTFFRCNMHLYRRMCLGHNSYHHWKWIQQPKFKSLIRLFAFYIALIPLGKIWIQLVSSHLIVSQIGLINLGMTTRQEGKLWIQTNCTQIKKNDFMLNLDHGRGVK